ncbi:RusA family crossover junction endodeoxyribonuclease [Novosphingobium meiothermophilum]|uniref:RusA family crossover junction endodeoxyribonuclease n=1 Tax=Novosphingobium meiothermophilum TaxID=2202251 RepID=UPI000D6E612E|nr:RusA family crossover junction endodeoxyribonuclease [Novosphingobium meiothermophilum]
MPVSHTFFLPIKPNATQRSRATCRGRFAQVYTDPKYKIWRDEAGSLLEQIASFEDFREVQDRPVRIITDIIVARPKTTKLAYPRGDIDNYEKGLWDAITHTGKWWLDDNQIIDNQTTKRWAKDGELEGYQITIEFL